MEPKAIKAWRCFVTQSLKKQLQSLTTVESQSGYILGLVMMFFVVFTIMGLGFVQMASHERVAGSNYYHKVKAFYYAEGGIHKGVWKANKVSTAAATFSNATVSVVYDSVSLMMTATGISGSVQDSIRVTLGSTTATADTVADDFDDGLGGSTDYTGNDGSQNWSTNWVEVGDGGSPTSGNILVETHGAMPTSGYHLKVQVNGSSGIYVYREVDLTGTTAATLTYIYRDEIGSGGQVDLEVSINGGSSWTTLKTYEDDSDTILNESVDLAPYLGNMVRIRFLVVDTGVQELRVDNVQIASNVTGTVTISTWEEL